MFTKILEFLTENWLLLVVILNLLTFALHAIFSKRAGAPHIKVLRQTNGSEDVSIFIAGNFDQASNVVCQIEDAAPNTIPGTIIAADFRGTGYRPAKFIGEIEAKIRSLPRGSTIRIFGISLGAQLGQIIAKDLNLQHIAINPCMNSDFLKPVWKDRNTACWLIFNPIKFVVGWVSYILLPAKFKKCPYSISLLADQYRIIAFFGAGPVAANTDVIISEHDEILVNDKIRDYFPNCHIESVDALHADFAHSAAEYARAISLIIKRT